MKYIVEYAKFIKLEIEADSADEANKKAEAIESDREYIDKNGKEYDPSGYILWHGAEDDE